MAVKLILTQIMKNESHVAKRMLDSIKSIVDGICVVDTGSTDDSIEVVKKWGEENGIETYVFERPFDNFENSRNHSFEKAREMFLSKNDGHRYYNFWLDFDEQLVIDKTFNKQSINKDLYMFNTFIRQMKYTRNELVRLDMDFKFYGPIHEYIIPPENTKITSDVLQGISVNVSMDGASWQEDIQMKYISHAHTLEKYISTNRKDPRWIFYTAQSYHDSSVMKDNRDENEERLRRAMKYYKERVERMDGYSEERFYSQYRIGTIMRTLEEPWNLTLQALLKAYSIEPTRGESIKTIIDYYLQMGEWDLAYMYADFGVNNFHGKNPYPKKLLFVDNALYTWKFLEVYSASCYYTNRKEEAKKSFNKILELTKTNPEAFSQDDLNKLETNKIFFA